MIADNIAGLKFSIVSDSDIPLLLNSISENFSEQNPNANLNFNSNFWYWQYKKRPEKKSFFYAAWLDKKIIGYYHIATYNFIFEQKKYLIGNIQDVAISKKYRGKGIFRKLAEFANTDINKHVDILYTFPNSSSIKTFLKYDKFHFISSLPVYLLPIKIDKIIRSKLNLFGIEKILGIPFNIYSKLKKNKLENNEELIVMSEFDEKVFTVFEKFSKLHSSHLLRNKEFLNWRYKNSPKGEFFIIGFKKNNEMTAVIVVKSEKIFNNEALIILDFCFSKDVNDLKKLISNFNSILIKNYSKKANFILLSGLSPCIPKITNCGFFSVPKFLIPRKINLLSRITNRSAITKHINSSSCLITLGDWDVF